MKSSRDVTCTLLSQVSICIVFGPHLACLHSFMFYFSDDVPIGLAISHVHRIKCVYCHIFNMCHSMNAERITLDRWGRWSIYSAWKPDESHQLEVHSALRFSCWMKSDSQQPPGVATQCVVAQSQYPGCCCWLQPWYLKWDHRTFTNQCLFSTFNHNISSMVVQFLRHYLAITPSALRRWASFGVGTAENNTTNEPGTRNYQ